MPGVRSDRDLVVLVPVLRRPHRAAPVSISAHRWTPGARVLFICTEGDDDMIQAARDTKDDVLVLPGPRRPGDYARKINTGYRGTWEPLMFLGADDLEFHEGWFAAVTAELRPGVGVVGTNDLGSQRVMAGDHSTHSLVTREYADEHGTADEHGAILHEGYDHEYVDDELVGTAKSRGAWAFAEYARVEHLHPDWGKAPVDDLYAAQRNRMRRSRALFERRRHLWT
jgi:hypothetical protein